MEATPFSLSGSSRRCQQRRRNRLVGWGSRWNLESKVPYSQPSFLSSSRSCCREDHGVSESCCCPCFTRGPCLVPARSLAPDSSPPAGRRGSPAPCSAPGLAPCDSGSARAPSVSDDMNGRSFPQGSRSGACQRVGSPLHTPSLQGQHHDL